MLTQQYYHGWLIKLRQESTGYSFECCCSERQMVIDNSNLYTSHDRALNAAYRRVDLETAGLALIRFLNDIYGRCYYLTSEDHIALTGSILEFLKSAG